MFQGGLAVSKGRKDGPRRNVEMVLPFKIFDTLANRWCVWRGLLDSGLHRNDGRGESGEGLLEGEGKALGEEFVAGFEG